MLTGDPRRAPTFDYTGRYRYFLTFSTNRRQQLFVRREHVDLVLSQFERTAREEGFVIVAYCFMPDRLHLLIEGRAAVSDCRRFVGRAKQYSGHHYSKAFGQRLWQRFGFDCLERCEEPMIEAARSVVEKPLRAGLVRLIEDYPFIGSLTHPIGDIVAIVAPTPAPALP